MSDPTIVVYFIVSGFAAMAALLFLLYKKGPSATPKKVASGTKSSKTKVKSKKRK